VGAIAIVGLALAVGIWGARAQIAGAVIGTGKVEVSSDMTAVQHQIGGVVKEILVENGDAVEAGQIVLRLDDALLRSDLTIVEGDLYEALANEARLTAAIDGRASLTLHPILEEARRANAEIRQLVDRQQRQLDAHFESIDTETRLLDEQIRQVEEQVQGTRAELNAKNERRGPITEELKQIKDLADKGLVKLSVLYTLQKENLTNEGDIGRLSARIAELEGKITELELKRHAVGPTAREKLATELGKVRPDRMRFLEKRNGILQSLSRLEIRSPISGTVHDSRIHGLRSVVVAASPLMFVVPREQPVLISVRVYATDIDQVRIGQDASIKFLAFNRRRQPVILGTVAKVSADAFLDPINQKHYYQVEVVLPAGESAKLGDRDLIPGMPVEAYLATEDRTPLSYFTKPILDYLDRALRDA
jgi:HlyD family secretion protein